MKICESCEIEHNGTYGKAGRFCSKSCSYKNRWKHGKRLENIRPIITIICKCCQQEFDTVLKNRIYCSQTCSNKNHSVETRSKHSKIMSVKFKGTANPMYGKSPSNVKRIIFNSLKNNSIFVLRSSYEVLACQKFENDNRILYYEYEPFSIPYLDTNNDHRTYTPDFKLVYADKIFIVEVKPLKMMNLWNNPLKIKILSDYCNENNYEMLILNETQLNEKNYS